MYDVNELDNIFSYFSMPMKAFKFNRNKACKLIAQEHTAWLLKEYSASVKPIVPMPIFTEMIQRAFEEYIYDNHPGNVQVVIKCRKTERLDDSIYYKRYQKIYTDTDIGLTVGMCCEPYYNIFYNCYFDFVLHPKLAALLSMG